jgi:TetR/AcrR family transcriptional regulator
LLAYSNIYLDKSLVERSVSHMKTSEILQRKHTRNPELVRSLILSAGIEIFAEKGYAGTSLRNISKLSTISVGLILYHFESKMNLYQEVRKHALTEYITSQEPQFALPDEEFDLFVYKGLQQYFRFLEEHPKWNRLNAWSLLEGSMGICPEENDLMDRLTNRITSGKGMGMIRNNLDSELLIIALGGMMQYWISYRSRYAHRLTHLGSPMDQEEAYLKLCLELLSSAKIDAKGKE